jgi:hypothetical protein
MTTKATDEAVADRPTSEAGALDAPPTIRLDYPPTAVDHSPQALDTPPPVPPAQAAVVKKAGRAKKGERA